MPKVIYVLTALILTLLPSTQVLAQSLDVSNVYELADTQAIDGDILTTTDKGLVRSTTPYDTHLFGILQTQSVVVFRRADNKGQPVSRYGNIQVNASTLNGNINTGDYITSSEIAGKGQKGDRSGYVVGIAFTSLDEKNGQVMDWSGKKVYNGKVTVALKIEYAEISSARSTGSLFNYFNAALFKNVQDPSKFAEIFRYIAAGGLVLASFAFGFITFSRSVPKGVEAIGRNPLAEKTIIFSIVLNIILTIITAAVGVVGAVLILRL